VQADRDKRVLQIGPRAGVRMNISRGNTWHPQPLAKAGELSVVGAIVTQKRTLQLDSQVITTEGVEQPSHGEFVMHATQRTSGQADESRSMLKHNG
jgi:hypothetical protein